MFGSDGFVSQLFGGPGSPLGHSMSSPVSFCETCFAPRSAPAAHAPHGKSAIPIQLHVGAFTPRGNGVARGALGGKRSANASTLSAAGLRIVSAGITGPYFDGRHHGLPTELEPTSRRSWRSLPVVAVTRIQSATTAGRQNARFSEAAPDLAPAQSCGLVLN